MSKTDGFYGELFLPSGDKYLGKALIYFSGSDGGIELLAGSLLPELVNAVIAVSPMNTICQGFAKKNGISFVSGSCWSFHDEELPYTAYGMEKFPLGQILRKSLKLRDVSMYDLYLPLVKNPNPNAVIQVEKTTGPILLISSKMDNMWPSELAAEHNWLLA